MPTRKPCGRRVAGTFFLRWICLALMVWLGSTRAVIAGESSQEFWPEVDTWLRLTPSWRLSAFVSISKNIETAYREGNLIVQGDYAFRTIPRARITRLMDEDRAMQMKRFLVRVGYLGGQSLGDNGQAYKEYGMLTELHVRTPIKGGVLLSHRLRSDLRWLGDSHEFSSRLRYRLMAEKEFTTGGSSIVPYVSGELYYDTRYGIVNRTRWIGGASVAWSKRFAIEGNYTYQHDTRSSVTNLGALNLILHLYFETRRAK